MTTALRRFPFQAMGTFCEIQFVDLSRIEARKKIRRLLAEVDRLEKKYSRLSQDSYLSQINASAGSGNGIDLDEETLGLIDLARSRFEESDGSVDNTAGALSRAWDFDKGRVPEQAELDRLLTTVGFEHLEVSASKLVLPEGMELHLSDLGTEYAAASVASLSRTSDITSGLINLGGVFAVIGPLPDDSPWPVGVLYPADGKKFMARLTFMEGGLASRGDYERPFTHQGKHYSRFLDARTGWPCDGLRAVTVTAENCIEAGAAAAIALTRTEESAISRLGESGRPYFYLGSDEQAGGDGYQAGTEIKGNAAQADNPA